jgi:hypothetical protein
VQKEELLHLHMLMVHIKKYYENITNDEIALEISPGHIHKNKKCHKDAILALGDEIVTHVKLQQPVMVDYALDTAQGRIAAEH